MSQALKELVESSHLERLDDNLFRGYGTWGSRLRLYGGQILSQAMAAAQNTTDPEFSVHSMHAYFVRPGDPALAVIYHVELARNGKSFCTRTVTARQHGEAILTAQFSLHRHEEGVEHQMPMPEAPAPEGLLNETQLRHAAGFETPDLSTAANVLHLPGDWPIEHYVGAPVDLFNPEPMPPYNQVWLRSAAPLPDDPALHQQLLVFTSDHNLLITSLRPHGISIATPNLQIASLDHSMWFHRPFRIDDWLLYVSESPSASNGRGFSTGRIYKRDGTLVASVAQEGLIRMRGKA
jgi:acyl-CoA thioesterase-2